jgi:hypothetical protein
MHVSETLSKHRPDLQEKRRAIANGKELGYFCICRSTGTFFDEFRDHVSGYDNACPCFRSVVALLAYSLLV